MTHPTDTDEEFDEVDNLGDVIEKRRSQVRELAWLFGEEVAEQADQIDIADLNMTGEITEAIAAGVKKLKGLVNDPQGQRQYVASLEPG